MMTKAEIPQTYSTTVWVTRPDRGVYQVARFLTGIVNTSHGPCEVQLGTLQALPGQAEPPARFSIDFATRDHPTGLTVHLDATDLLEAIVRGYFEERGDDRPVPPESPLPPSAPDAWRPKIVR
jgi:hypothetical protein